MDPVSPPPVYRGLGRCAWCFWLAVAFDLLGLLVLLLGVFVDVFFYDLLVYAGAIVIFLSLVWWVFWYSGNIEVPPAELEDDVGLKKNKGPPPRGALGLLGGAVRRLSGRVSSGIRRSLRGSGSRSGFGSGARARSPGSAAAAEQEARPRAEHVTIAMETMEPPEDGAQPRVGDVEAGDRARETPAT